MFTFGALAPTAVVVVDGRTDRPCQIRLDGARLAISALEAVRDETAAYPLGMGPRTVFVVRSQGRRFRLVHLLRERRWTIEELTSSDAGLTCAA